MRLLIATLLLCAAYTTQADSVYKCEVGGVVKYSQTPCGDSDTKIDIKDVNQPTSPKYKIATKGFVPINTTDSPSAYILKKKIKRHERNIGTYTKKMKREVDTLKVRTYSANNNLAGAIYQDSLSKEMIAVTNKYNTLIDVQKAKIKNLKDLLSSIQPK